MSLSITITKDDQETSWNKDDKRGYDDRLIPPFAISEKKHKWATNKFRNLFS